MSHLHKKLDAFHLKSIALTAMLLNHIGSGFHLNQTAPWLFFGTEFIGKLTFPIMAYLLVEGFHYSKNRLKYAGRLALFWLLSILPFYLLFDPNQAFTLNQLVNNIFFTLLLGLFLLMLCEKINSATLQWLLVTIFALLSSQSDWNIIGIYLIFGFYALKNKQNGIRIPLIACTICLFLLLLVDSYYFPSEKAFLVAFSSFGILLAVPLLENYNGQRGYAPNWLKWGFYLFYPVHLWLLVLIRAIL